MGSPLPSCFRAGLLIYLCRTGRRRDQASPDGYDYSPQKLAERYGFKGFSWKALAVGCKADSYFYFPDRKTALFQIEDILMVLKRD
jgi:hypothetical protein